MPEKSQKKKGLPLTHNGRSHKEKCDNPKCGILFSPDLFPTKGGERYEGLCKVCYRKARQIKRKAKKKKEERLKKAQSSRANNKLLDLDDFDSEIVSIADLTVNIKKQLTDLIKEILCNQRRI